eukprot:gene17279-biopygen12800
MRRRRDTKAETCNSRHASGREAPGSFSHRRRGRGGGEAGVPLKPLNSRRGGGGAAEGRVAVPNASFTYSEGEGGGVAGRPAGRRPHGIRPWTPVVGAAAHPQSPFPIFRRRREGRDGRGSSTPSRRGAFGRVRDRAPVQRASGALRVRYAAAFRACARGEVRAAPPPSPLPERRADSVRQFQAPIKTRERCARNAVTAAPSGGARGGRARRGKKPAAPRVRRRGAAPPPRRPISFGPAALPLRAPASMAGLCGRPGRIAWSIGSGGVVDSVGWSGLLDRMAWLIGSGGVLDCA